jgi:16S rRNA G1207 methylase RsmC
MRDYTKFFTPSHTAKLLVSLVNPQTDDVVLEPSAGEGAIVRAIKQHNAGVKVFAFDINKDFKPLLRNAGANVVVIKDFLLIPVYAKFTSCIANPPFGNGIDLQAHFDHICDHVKDGGKIVMIVPIDFNPNYSKHFIKNFTARPLENWSKNSDGTTTEIKIIEFINS